MSSPMDEAALEFVWFTDIVRRPIYAHRDRQFVVVDNEKVYGVFIIPEEDRCDMPIIIGDAPF